MEEAWAVLELGAQSRHSAQTKMNERSSRSHCMLCVKVRGHSKLTGDRLCSSLQRLRSPSAVHTTAAQEFNFPHKLKFPQKDHLPTTVSTDSN